MTPPASGGSTYNIFGPPVQFSSYSCSFQEILAKQLIDTPFRVGDALGNPGSATAMVITMGTILIIKIIKETILTVRKP